MFILNVHFRCDFKVRQKKDFAAVVLTFYAVLYKLCLAAHNALTMIPKIKTISEKCCAARCPENETVALSYCNFLVGQCEFPSWRMRFLVGKYIVFTLAIGPEPPL